MQTNNVDNSFTEFELKMIEDIVYAHGRYIYGDERVMTLIHKIETMLVNKIYLSEDETNN